MFYEFLCFKKINLRRSIFILPMVALLWVFTMATPAHAALVDNGDGTITDTGFDLMWLKNANKPDTSMTWDEAVSWVDTFEWAGYSDWRLPIATNRDGTGPFTGYDQIGSEMGHLYYTELGNDAGVPFNTYEPFENMQTAHEAPGYARYWYGDDDGSLGAWMLTISSGSQGMNSKEGVQVFVLPVRSVVPEPSSMILAAIGLGSLMGLRKRKRRQGASRV